MNVSLTPQLEDLINQRVSSGLYNSASEVVREALRLLEERDRMRDMKLAALRKDIKMGLDSGESVPLDVGDIIERGRKRLAKGKAKK